MLAAEPRSFMDDLPPALVIAWVGAIGLFVGSFLNVVVYRLPRNCLSINKPKRSFCPQCKTQLTMKDNIPVFGWVLLGGKCRYCKKPYSIRYPAVELLTGLLFSLTVWRFIYDGGSLAGSGTAWLAAFSVIVMICVLLPMSLIDLEMRQIPDTLSLGALMVFVPLAANPATMEAGLPGDVSALVFDSLPRWLNGIVSALLAGVVAAGFLWLMGKVGNVLFRKRTEAVGGSSMGFGDVKLMLLLGVMLGWPKLVGAFFVAIFAGVAIGIPRRMIDREAHGVPFGPFLALGALASMLATPQMVAFYEWYMNFIQGAAR